MIAGHVIEHVFVGYEPWGVVENVFAEYEPWGVVEHVVWSVVEHVFAEHVVWGVIGTSLSMSSPSTCVEIGGSSVEIVRQPDILGHP